MFSFQNSVFANWTLKFVAFLLLLKFMNYRNIIHNESQNGGQLFGQKKHNF